MVAQRYRWDFIGLSSQAKPTKATSDKVTNGSTYYESDTSKLYVFYGNQWYEKTAPGGGGGGTSDFDQLSNRPKYNGTAMTHETNIPEVITYSNFTGTDGTAAGTSGLVPAPATTDAGKFLKADGTWDTTSGGGDTVYSTATTSYSSTGGAVYIGNLDSNQDEKPDPTTTDQHYRYFWALPYDNAEIPQDLSINIFGQNSGQFSISLGNNAIVRLDDQIAIGRSTLNNYSATNGIAIGRGAQCLNANSMAIGRGAKTSRDGEVNVGAGTSGDGYNSTNYRVIGGVYDGQLANDAVTVGQVNDTIDAINTALSTNIPHIGASS